MAPFPQPEAVIPSADTVFKYLATNEVEDALRFFQQVYSELFSVTGMPKEPVDIAVDFHDVVGVPKLTPDIVSVTTLNKDYATLCDAVINRLKDRGLKLGTLFLHREFFNLASIRTRSCLQVNFIMAAPSNKRIKRLVGRAQARERAHTGDLYLSVQSAAFFSIVIRNPDYPRTGIEKKSEFLRFATNVDFGSLRRRLPRSGRVQTKKEHRDRLYRVKNVVKIRTCAKNALPRVLFFTMQCLPHNYLNVLKRILELSAQRLKALVTEDIEQPQRGTVSRVPRFWAFYAALRGYNKRRQSELRARLAVAT
ncbi:MAG: hypothetical protein ACP5E9_10240 [Candidatus Methanospirareceae archaeon]